MATDQNPQAASPTSAKAAAALLARDLVRAAWKGTLSTVSRTAGHPYGSLVALATEPDGAPLLLLSGLAEHTKNIEADQRASVLIDGTSPGRAALTGPRVTLVGRIVEAAPETARRRYLARHPDASGFIDFADFKLYALRVEWAHLVAGFGRIVRLDAGDVLVSTSDAASLIEAEASVLEHMNGDHSDALAVMARHALEQGRSSADEMSGTPAPWRMVGCDPEGIDLTDGTDALRLHFPQCVTNPDAVRAALVDMVRVARASDLSHRAIPKS